MVDVMIGKSFISRNEVLGDKVNLSLAHNTKVPPPQKEDTSFGAYLSQC
jgi:hypothetical protein